MREMSPSATWDFPAFAVYGFDASTNSVWYVLDSTPKNHLEHCHNLRPLDVIVLVVWIATKRNAAVKPPKDGPCWNHGEHNRVLESRWLGQR